MIELALRDERIEPFVERMPGPIVRLTMDASTTLEAALVKCRTQLHDALEWAIAAVYADDGAPGRVFVRDANGTEMVTMVDPCLTYGLDAIVRPKDL